MEGYRALVAACAILFRARPEAWLVIVGFIWPLAALTARHLLRVRRHLEAERKALYTCRAALDLMLREGRIVDGELLEAAVRGVAPNGLVATAVRTLWEVRLLPSVELDAIARMLRESEAARLGTARSMPNRLMLLGLLGTVAGLAGVIGSLAPQIQGTLDHPDAIALTRNLGAALEHMQGAFACTAWGILTAVAIAALTGLVAAMQNCLLRDLQIFALRELAPRFFPARQEVQLENIRLILTESRSFLQGVASTMDGAAQHFQTVLQEAGSSMTASVSKLQGVASSMQSDLGSVANAVKESAGVLQKSSGQVKETADKLHEYHTHLRNAYIELSSLFQESQKGLEQQTTGLLDKVAELQRSFGASTEAIVNRIDGVATKMDEATGAFTGVGDRFEKSGLDLNGRLDRGFQSLQEEVAALLGKHRDEMSLVEVQLRLLADRLEKLTQSLNPESLPREEWDAVCEALRKCTQELQSIQFERGDFLAMTGRIKHLLEDQSPNGNHGNVPRALAVADGPSISAMVADFGDAVREMNLRTNLAEVQASLERLGTAVNRLHDRLTDDPDPGETTSPDASLLSRVMQVVHWCRRAR